MNTPLIMTPGPTMVCENVRNARSLKYTNPDIDPTFKPFYIELCNKIGRLINTKNLVTILSGEAILGLEAACASLTEKGDKVLVLDNGVYGETFKDFVKMYGGEPVILKSNKKREFDLNILKDFLEKDSDFKYATIVHCDTPSGVLNDISKICPLLNKYGILTVVDSVSTVGGEEIYADKWKMDIVIGGSQKAISAPTGLTILSISNDAFKSMESRKTPIKGFYCNLLNWKDYKTKIWFPYTMPISDIHALNIAIDNILNDKNIFIKHRNIAMAIRNALVKSGLKLYLENGFSNTITAIELEESINDKILRDNLLKHFNLLIAGSISYLEGKVIRIGHMGENLKIQYIVFTLTSLQKELELLGFKMDLNLAKTFLDEIHK